MQQIPNSVNIWFMQDMDRQTQGETGGGQISYQHPPRNLRPFVRLVDESSIHASSPTTLGLVIAGVSC